MTEERVEVRISQYIPFQLHHKQGLIPVIKSYVTGASVLNACQVSGSSVFPPCDILNV